MSTAEWAQYVGKEWRYVRQCPNPPNPVERTCLDFTVLHHFSWNDLQAMPHGQNGLMRIKLIEELPMACSAELYQLSWAIEQLLADPRRIVQARGELHTGQQVQYLNWDDGKLRAARVIAMKDCRVTVLDEASRSHFTVPYAAWCRRRPAPCKRVQQQKLKSR